MEWSRTYLRFESESKEGVDDDDEADENNLLLRFFKTNNILRRTTTKATRIPQTPWMFDNIVIFFLFPFFFHTSLALVSSSIFTHTSHHIFISSFSLLSISIILLFLIQQI
jgi:hypothetical protein